jgi:hypothetical protein
MDKPFLLTVGTRTKWEYDIQKIIRDAKLDFEVTKSSLYIKVKDKYIQIKDHFAVARVDNGRMFGSCGKNYRVAQHANALAFMNVYCAKPDGPKPIQVGSTEYGSKAFIVFKNTTDILPSVEDHFICLSSHDSKNGVEIRWWPLLTDRQVYLSIPDTHQIYRHALNFQESRPNFTEYLNKVEKGKQRLIDFYDKSSKLIYSEEEIIEILMPIVLDHRTSADATLQGLKTIQFILSLAYKSNQSLWDIYCSICEYAERHIPVKIDAKGELYLAEFCWLRNYSGIANKLKLDAFKELERHVKLGTN